MDPPDHDGITVFSTNFKYDQAREFFGLDPSKTAIGAGFENRLNLKQKK